MSAFSAGWLALREPVDADSRSVSLVTTLVSRLAVSGRPGPLQVVDLGAGTGANLRYLAPRLGGPQEWVAVEQDRALLDTLDQRLSQWATELGCAFGREGEFLVVRGQTFGCRVRKQQTDLRRLEHLTIPDRALVTASALLDLVANDWLKRLAERCAAVEAVVYFALSYDGRIKLSPVDPLDDMVRELINRHQRTDKGFGTATGPDSARTCTKNFGARGYEMTAAGSDWVLGPLHRDLQLALLDGWSEAAAEMAPERRNDIAEWRQRRNAHVAAGLSEVHVGHIDTMGFSSPGGPQT